jgi:hypothetical protein
MLEVIRTILTNFKQGVYNIFTGSGRPDEEIRATSYQHYGFVSVPPAGTEFITLQYGQNAVSVAENGGNSFNETLTEGSTVLYSKSGSILHMDGTDPTFSVKTSVGDAHTEPLAINISSKTGDNFIRISGQGAINREVIYIDNSSKNDIQIYAGGSKIDIDGLNGFVTINNGNFVVNVTPLIPGVLQPLANAAFVSAVCSALSIPVLPTYTTQSVMGL